jgi:phenylpropionate dioxygenase-like ring-hydroxylating dioxygenase large terminal subunit
MSDMLLDFWYPVAFSTDLGRTPRRVAALGRRLVLWRTRTGGVGALSDLCVHRGAALSGGKVTGDEITCPYHGWAYRTDGSCARIPAHPERGIPARARVDSYPVEERYGIVWAFLGDRPEPDRPPIPDWPEIEDPGWRRIQGTFTWHAHVDRVVEGGLDFAHGPFVHEGTFGRGLDPRIDDYTVTTTPWSGQAHDGGGSLSWHLPSSTRTELRFDGRRQLIYQAHLPVDDTRTRTHYVILRDFARSPLADAPFRWMNLRVLREDRRVVDDLHPELLPYDLADELHVRSDALQLSYRRRRRELIARGWPTTGDPAAVGPAAVIASPARRDPALARAWVHTAGNGTGDD